MRFALPAFALLCALPLPAAAVTPETDAFGQCLVAQSKGEDRILLARWMTLAFAAHPAVQDAVSRDMSKIDETNQGVAALFMELLTERCVTEAKAAVAAEGDAGVAMQKAFEMLGAVASQEAMMASEVSNALSGFITHVDEAALMSALGQ
jgi:enoyl-[acyl-carrier-protein] reductase (NADH)